MIRNLLLSGGPAHDFDATSGAIAALLASGDGDAIDTTIMNNPGEVLASLGAAAADRAPRWDLLTVNALHWRMEIERYTHLRRDCSFNFGPVDGELVDAYVRGGGGLLAVHTAVICFDAEPHWRALTGASWNWKRSSHPPVAEVAVQITDAGRCHPITQGIDPFRIFDEVYGFLDAADDIEPLLAATWDGIAHPLLWARTAGAGRVVTDLLGHGVESVTHPAHRTILQRAATWTLGSPA